LRFDRGEPIGAVWFGVWLFDKRYPDRDQGADERIPTDVDTRDAWQPRAIRDAEPGGVISRRTASLEVDARVVDMSYGMGALPAESYFVRVTIELRAWSRHGTNG
jgi:hypothetical protein